MAESQKNRNTDEIEASIVEYFYEQKLSGHKCGYCGSKDTFMTNGMWAHRLAGQDYQDLIDRGWRRSGKYLYKPVMSRTCCPLYTIRCEAIEYKPSRSQKRVARKMRAFLVEGKFKELPSPVLRTDKEKPDKDSKNEEMLPQKDQEPCEPNEEVVKESEEKNKESNEGGKELQETESEAKTNVSEVDCNSAAVTMSNDTAASQDEITSNRIQKRKTPREGVGADPNKPRCRKAKAMRREKKKKKLCLHEDPEVKVVNESKEEKPEEQVEEMGTSVDTPQIEKTHPEEKETETKPLVMIEDLLNIPPDQELAHTLETKMVQCYPPSQDFTSTFIESYMLYKKYQVSVHGDKEEELSERSFRRFLCDTPLIALDGPIGWDRKYGTFHYQYYVDGKLIMVAVLDILPTYLSSVYVYYDPDYRWLELGVYSALKEIELVQKLNRSKPEFQYYCMGYYVHNNPKMSYKGNYIPSYLLCPETYRYVPISDAKQQLDKTKYSKLNHEPQEVQRVLSFLGGVLILFEKQVIPYMLFRTYYGHMKDRIVIEYASLAGREVTQRMFLYLTLDASQQEDDSDD